MSQHIYVHQGVEVRLGYDRILNYVFCSIFRNGNLEYSNLDDSNAGTEQQDVEYFRPIIQWSGVTVPEKMFEEVKRDQANQVGNRVVDYSRDAPDPAFVKEMQGILLEQLRKKQGKE